MNEYQLEGRGWRPRISWECMLLRKFDAALRGPLSLLPFCQT